MNLPPNDDSDDDLDTNVPSIISKPKNDRKNTRSKYKGVFRIGKKFKAQIQTGVRDLVGETAC